MRGILREHGLPIGIGARTALTRIPALLADAEVPLPDLVRHTLRLLLDDVRALESRLATIDRQLAQVAREHPVAQRLQQIPGVGVLTATALIDAVSHIHAFRRGRHFASWLGLTPREVSTGGRRHLGSISKRGDVYLLSPLLAHAWRPGRSADCAADGAHRAISNHKIATMGRDGGRWMRPQQSGDRRRQ